MSLTEEQRVLSVFLWSDIKYVWSLYLQDPHRFWEDENRLQAVCRFTRKESQAAAAKVSYDTWKIQWRTLLHSHICPCYNCMYVDTMAPAPTMVAAAFKCDSCVGLAVSPAPRLIFWTLHQIERWYLDVPIFIIQDALHSYLGSLSSNARGKINDRFRAQLLTSQPKTVVTL